MAHIQDVETPAVLIDLDVIDRNIARAQARFDALGVAFRPHVKTHKLPEFAELQRAAGARGIAAQKISEAEVFAAHGFHDILLCTTPLSPAKIARLRRLADSGACAVVADSLASVQALSARNATPLTVLVECDTGAGRCGVQSPEAACDLALRIAESPGLRFGGLMTYPGADGAAQVQAFMSQSRALILASGAACPVISSGGTPGLLQAHLAPIVTEYRAGTYIYNDRSLLARGLCRTQDCALTVLTTVLSCPVPDRAILDAGSKSLTSDLLGLTGYGQILDLPGAEIVGLSEEHGHVDLRRAAVRPRVGQKLQVIPNHACPVSNLVDWVVLHRAGRVERSLRVAARGMVQ